MVDQALPMRSRQRRPWLGVEFFRNAPAFPLERFEVTDQGILGILDGLLVGGAPGVASQQCRKKGEVTGFVRVEFYRECVGNRLLHDSILSDRPLNMRLS